jgi:hypothetical protein
MKVMEKSEGMFLTHSKRIDAYPANGCNCNFYQNITGFSNGPFKVTKTVVRNSLAKVTHIDIDRKRERKRKNDKEKERNKEREKKGRGENVCQIIYISD